MVPQWLQWLFIAVIGAVFVFVSIRDDRRRANQAKREAIYVSYQVPADMTPHRLRMVAEMLDVYDTAFIRTAMMMRDEGKELSEEGLQALCGTEMQDSLRRWANEIENNNPPEGSIIQ